MTEEEIEFLRSFVEPKPHERTCALCLAPVPRVDYDKHMQAHGYETLRISPMENENGLQEKG